MKQQAMILVSVLYFLMLIILLLLLEVQLNSMQLQINQNHLNRVKSVQVAQIGLQKTYQLLVHHQTNCQISHLSPEELLKKSDHWWQAVGCTYYQTQSVIEHLQQDICAHLATGNAVQYDRITTKSTHVFLQIVVARSITTAKICPGKSRELTHILQSWRELII